MATVTLRPNADVTTGWSFSGSGRWQSISSPDSDATYIMSGFYLDSYTGAFGSFTFPTNAQIRLITPRVRVANSVTTNALTFFLLYGSSDNYTPYTITATTTITTYTLASANQTGFGASFTQAIIDGLEFSFLQSSSSPTQNQTAYEVYADVLYNEAPVVAVSGPTEGSSVTTTTRPTVTWGYTDPESDAQERYRIKIFSSAQYLAGGFDPEVSIPTIDSGELFGTANSYVVPTDLANSTTYRAYVKVADAGSNGRYSLWDNNTFTVTVAAPPAPTLVVTAQPLNATGPRNMLQITRAVSGTATTYMVIEYQDAGTATWTVLRGASKIVNSPDGTTFTLYDYEITSGVQRSYRAKAIRTV